MPMSYNNKRQFRAALWLVLLILVLAAGLLLLTTGCERTPAPDLSALIRDTTAVTDERIAAITEAGERLQGLRELQDLLVTLQTARSGAWGQEIVPAADAAVAAYHEAGP